jgi:hypothetical protein
VVVTPGHAVAARAREGEVKLILPVTVGGRESPESRHAASHIFHPVPELITLQANPSVPRGGVYEHVQAEEARAHHVRPQDADKPVTGAPLAKGTRVSYATHAHAGVGIVGSPLGTCAEVEGLSLATHEGRGEHANEVGAGGGGVEGG